MVRVQNLVAHAIQALLQASNVNTHCPQSYVKAMVLPVQIMIDFP